MSLHKFLLKRALPLAGVALLVSGLGIALVASQQQQDQRSEAHSSDAPTLGTLPVVPGEQQQTVDIKINCTTSGQLCEPIFKKIIQTHSVLKVNYTVGSLHCSAVKIHFLVDDVEKKVSDWLGWPDGDEPYNTGVIDLGPVSSGTHTLGVKAEGKSGGCNEGKLGAWEGKLVIATNSASQTPPPPPSNNTTFNLDLLFHGIGKGGDNQNAAGGGNPTPLHPTRSVIVDVYDLDNNPVVTAKEGQVTFDPASGTYKGTVAMGTALTTAAYTIKAKLSHSLRASIARNITAGTASAIPQMTLISGDTNNDGKLDMEDYNIIQGCYSDFDLPPVDCNVTKRAQADIDDDGKVNQFDLNLFLREMSVQAL
jgi:hypothetical protein